jgi:hypothetical protein
MLVELLYACFVTEKWEVGGKFSALHEMRFLRVFTGYTITLESNMILSLNSLAMECYTLFVDTGYLANHPY